MSELLSNNNRATRAYTLAEIDIMRECIFNMLTFMEDMSYHSAVAEARERLRTYILANVEPQELVDKWEAMRTSKPIPVFEQPHYEWKSC